MAVSGMTGSGVTTLGNPSLSRLEYTGTEPTRAHPTDAGYDLRANLPAPVVIGPGERRLIPSGTHAAIPAGYAGLVTPRSGLAAKHGVTVLNSPGLIDPGYTGEIGVVLHNTDMADAFNVAPGDRVAQLVIVPVVTPPTVRAEKLPAAGRGDAGFGSTGR